jgi:hypothetical protein
MIFICLFSCAAIWLRHGASLSAAASADYIDKPFGDDDQHPTAYYNNSPKKWVAVGPSFSDIILYLFSAVN